MIRFSATISSFEWCSLQLVGAFQIGQVGMRIEDGLIYLDPVGDSWLVLASVCCYFWMAHEMDPDDIV